MWSLAVFFFRKVRMLEMLKDSQQPRAEQSTAVNYFNIPPLVEVCFHCSN